MPTHPAFTMSHAYGRGRAHCDCHTPHAQHAQHAPHAQHAQHAPPRFIVVTGGPGAGKTAVLELARQRFCSHVRVLPEAATILFGGGFPRLAHPSAARAAQRAIYRVQVELEAAALVDDGAAVVLCDRGTLDGLGYCGGDEDVFLAELGTTRERELARYATVIHMHTPPAPTYERDNGIRIEDAVLAAAIDKRLEEAWRGHPHVVHVESSPEFLQKAQRVLDVLAREVPLCCRAPGRSAVGTDAAKQVA